MSISELSHRAISYQLSAASSGCGVSVDIRHFVEASYVEGVQKGWRKRLACDCITSPHSEPSQ
jgi:hypothetical protein